MMLRDLKEENIFHFVLKQYLENYLNMGIFQYMYKK